MSRRARTRRDKRAPQPDFDDDTTAADAVSKGRVALCPQCGQMRRNQSPYAYVWWHVIHIGRMCWHCYKNLKK